MFCLHKIYEGSPRISDAFRFTAKDYQKAHGVFASGPAELSLAFDNGEKLLIRNFEERFSSHIAPNKRPFLFNREINQKLVSGVITGLKIKEKDMERLNVISVYLIVSKDE